MTRTLTQVEFWDIVTEGKEKQLLKTILLTDQDSTYSFGAYLLWESQGSYYIASDVG